VLAFVGLRPHGLDDLRHRNRGSYAPIDPALRERLERHFAEPNRRLAALLGREPAYEPVAAEGPRRASVASAERSPS
jgi:hypothetical protein